MQSISFVVRTGIGTVNTEVDRFTDEIEEVCRVPRQHSSWKSVKYKGQRYQLHGGIRTPHFICLNNPIDGRFDRQTRLESRMMDFFRRVVREKLSHNEYLAVRQQEIFDSDDWKSAPRHLQEFIFGMEKTFLDGPYGVWANVVFAYEVNGTVMTIDSEEYKNVSPIEINEKWSHTGRYVWKSDTSRIWT